MTGAKGNRRAPVFIFFKISPELQNLSF